MTSRNCAYCEEPLERRPEEKKAAYLKRLTCNAHCGGLYREAKKRGEKMREKPCQFCGGLFGPSAFETVHQYHHRKYCSLAHAEMGKRGVDPDDMPMKDDALPCQKRWAALAW